MNYKKANFASFPRRRLSHQFFFIPKGASKTSPEHALKKWKDTKHIGATETVSLKRKGCLLSVLARNLSQ